MMVVDVTGYVLASQVVYDGAVRDAVVVARPAAEPPKPAPTVTPATLPGWLAAFQRCVIAHESLNAGLYTAHNPTSTASGAYQFIDSTWRAWTARAGIGREYLRAMFAPPAVQDAVFFYGVSHGGGGAWAGDGCGHGST